MNRELLVALAGKLGVSYAEDISDEDLGKLVAVKVDSIVVPMSQATEAAEKQQDFREQFPEKAAQLDRLMERDRANEAKTFAASFESFEDQPKKGFSGVVRAKIEDAHMKISERRITSEDLNELLTAASAKDGVVEYGEAGSSREIETTAARAGATSQEIRAQVADLIQTAMTEDSLDRKAAMNHVATENPELWNSYVRS